MSDEGGPGSDVVEEVLPRPQLIRGTGFYGLREMRNAFERDDPGSGALIDKTFKNSPELVGEAPDNVSAES